MMTAFIVLPAELIVLRSFCLPVRLLPVVPSSWENQDLMPSPPGGAAPVLPAVGEIVLPAEVNDEGVVLN